MEFMCKSIPIPIPYLPIWSVCADSIHTAADDSATRPGIRASRGPGRERGGEEGDGEGGKKKAGGREREQNEERDR